MTRVGSLVASVLVVAVASSCRFIGRDIRCDGRDLTCPNEMICGDDGVCVDGPAVGEGEGEGEDDTTPRAVFRCSSDDDCDDGGACVGEECAPVVWVDETPSSIFSIASDDRMLRWGFTGATRLAIHEKPAVRGPGSGTEIVELDGTALELTIDGDRTAWVDPLRALHVHTTGVDDDLVVPETQLFEMRFIDDTLFGFDADEIVGVALPSGEVARRAVAQDVSLATSTSLQRHGDQLVVTLRDTLYLMPPSLDVDGTLAATYAGGEGDGNSVVLPDGRIAVCSDNQLALIDLDAARTQALVAMPQRGDCADIAADASAIWVMLRNADDPIVGTVYRYALLDPPSTPPLRLLSEPDLRHLHRVGDHLYVGTTQQIRRLRIAAR